jgi:diguanylate cyclase
MSEPPRTESGKQALRFKRALLASTTYVLGLLMLFMCSLVGLVVLDHVLLIGLAFLVVNLAFLAAIRSGWNLRFKDPALTMPQVLTGAVVVALILVLGEQVHFLALPFYSSLFVFAMLQLKPRELIGVEVFVLVSYGAAIAMRVGLFSGRLDLRIEAINVGLVVLSSIWYTMAASYISNLRARLRQSLQTIERLASRDALTDTWNRRHIDATLSAELQRKARSGASLCVCMVDLDHFKSINDRFGHLVGDAVLRSVAHGMKCQLRTTDQLGRFGGEEFLIVLPATSLDDAQVCAERLRISVSSLTGLADPDERITISIGLAECRPGETADDLLSRVDSALYRAKQNGRDRVAIAAAPGAPAADHPGQLPGPPLEAAAPE